MKRQYDLLKDDVKSLYFRYLLPSISATLVTSIYVLADTIIIGKGIGEQAVAALNLVLPLFTIFFGTGLLFGVGGSIQMTLHRAANRNEEANGSFTTALFSNIAMVILYLALGLFAFEPLMNALGSTAETIGYVREYGRFLVTGIPFFLFSTFLQAFIRNDQAPKLSMIGVITGGVLNIILDIIFVYGFHWGMSGAALATVLGSVTTCCILLTHFFTAVNSIRLDVAHCSFSKLVHIVTNGLSSFLIELASGMLAFFFNQQLLAYIGVLGLTVYSIISNTAIVVMSLSNGISQAAQPIITMNYGAGEKSRIKAVRHLGLIVSLIIGSVFALIGLLAPEFVVKIFLHPTPEIMELAPTAIRIYFISFIGCILNMFLSNYCQSTVKPLLALFICLIRGFVLSTFFVYLLPALFGPIGIWITMPITEVITLILAALLIKKSER